MYNREENFIGFIAARDVAAERKGMAVKTKKTEEVLSLIGETVKVVSYADYFARRPLFTSLQVKNAGEEAINDLTLSFYNENGMLLSFQKTIEEIPFESLVEVELENLLSPNYFAGLDAVKEEKITVTLRKENKVIATLERSVTALPFDYWQGTEGDLELLSSFVRPRLADCAPAEIRPRQAGRRSGPRSSLASLVP